MKWDVIHTVSCGISLFVMGCIEPYTIEGVQADPQYLVVDGFLNASEKTTCKVKYHGRGRLTLNTFLPKKAVQLFPMRHLPPPHASTAGLMEEAQRINPHSGHEL